MCADVYRCVSVGLDSTTVTHSVSESGAVRSVRLYLAAHPLGRGAALLVQLVS